MAPRARSGSRKYFKLRQGILAHHDATGHDFVLAPPEAMGLAA